MANHDIERGGPNPANSDPAIDSIQASEETSLLSENIKKLDYEATDVSSGESSLADDEASKEASEGRSPFGIISLLLVGKTPPPKELLDCPELEHDFRV